MRAEDGAGMVGSEVVEKVKGLSAEDYESIVRSFGFILSMLVNHWKI